MKFLLTIFGMAMALLTVLGQNCGGSQSCISSQKSTIQAGCGGVSNNQQCLCQYYDQMIAQCLSGCSDPESLTLISSLRNEQSSYCQSYSSQAISYGANGMNPMNNGFFATNTMNSPSSLIINNGPTGLAIPANNGFGNQGATISMAYTPIKISGGETAIPCISLLALVTTSTLYLLF